MLKYFICPDNQYVEIEKCIANGGCRLGKRCLTRATLVELSKVRPWNGIPSTTQLLVGTYEMMLRITRDYAESPQDTMFRLLGTRVHGGLEGEDLEDSIMEADLQMVTSYGISMRPDLLEKEDNWNILTDYKVAGSYKVRKALGLHEYVEDHPTDVYKITTKVKDPISGVDIVRKPGQPKIVKKWRADIKKQDCLDWVRQLNMYRIGIEEKGDRVDEMRIEAIVRDGGLYAATSNGVSDRVYLIPIPEVPNEHIIRYFTYQRDNLLKALKNNDWEYHCNSDECWGGNKCKIQQNGRSYCTVRSFCKFEKDK